MNKKLAPLLFALLARNRSVGGWITIAAVVVIYLLVQPVLSAKLGLPLPGLLGDGADRPAVASTDSAKTSPTAIGDLVLKPKARSSQPVSNAAESGETADEPLAQATTEPSAATSRDATKADPEDTRGGTKSQAPLGKLTEVAPKVFETTAGLRYGPGSVDRHRLLHVMQHAKDRPDKPVHGVFRGDEYEIRAMIDEAYLVADLRGPPQAKKSVEGDRTIWKVDMKRKVGYLGGQVGKRKNNPPLTGIQLVLEGVNVITAYPIDPRR